MRDSRDGSEPLAKSAKLDTSKSGKKTRAVRGGVCMDVLSVVGEGYSHYAGFWRRFGAYWIDVIVWLPLTALSFS